MLTRIDNFCLDADNFSIIFPEDPPRHPNVHDTSYHDAIVSIAQSDIDKWTLNVKIIHGCVVAYTVFSSSQTINHKLDDLQIKQLRNAWTPCHKTSILSRNRL